LHHAPAADVVTRPMPPSVKSIRVNRALGGERQAPRRLLRAGKSISRTGSASGRLRLASASEAAARARSSSARARSRRNDRKGVGEVRALLLSAWVILHAGPPPVPYG
jgi:hypothetical protein